MGILLDDADKARCRGFLAGGIRVAYEDASAVGRPFAAKQRCEGGFAGAASSQNGNNATVRYRKAQVLQNRTIRARVGEGHVLKTNVVGTGAVVYGIMSCGGHGGCGGDGSLLHIFARVFVQIRDRIAVRDDSESRRRHGAERLD